ncbi:hypothetical protein SO802_000386 [Lithocarpus litseifolius]|uniref:Major facilitator superfamily (MFS) profile domain-containing protein n=1 Tax=Lithocarpus litseifolius TaxID=425828 RepID=A0AAW2DRV1_9ROSI
MGWDRHPLPCRRPGFHNGEVVVTPDSARALTLSGLAYNMHIARDVILFFVIGVLPQAFLLMEDESDIGKLKDSFQNVLLGVGLGAAMVGSAGGPWVIETFGRKISLLLADLFFIIGTSIFSMAPYTGILVVGRVCVGLSLGVFTILTPQLLAEISTTAIRGSLTALNGLFFGLGYLLSCLISLVLAKVEHCWRLMIAFGAIFPFIQMFFIFKIGVESPLWLLKEGQTAQAVELLEKLHPMHIADELRVYFINIVEKGGSSFLQKFKLAVYSEPFLRALRAGLVVQAAQSFAGFKIVLKFLPSVLEMCGMKSSVLATQLPLISALLTCLGFVSTFMVIDRVGRRILLTSSLTVITVVHLALGLILKTNSKHDQTEENRVSGFAEIMLYFIFFLAYAIGIGTITPIYNSEIFECTFSLLGMGLSNLLCWSLSLLIEVFFVPVASSLKAEGTFYLSFGFSLLGSIAIYLMVPETLQKSPEEILELMKQKFRPWPFNNR